MPIDYSKWDKIELSDDSDIEVHPNVDKSSFIKWKQRDIHEKRIQRDSEIKGLRVQKEMYINLNKRVDSMLIELNDELIVQEKARNLYLSDKFDKSEKCTIEQDNDSPTYNEMVEDLFTQITEDLKKDVKDVNDAKLLRSKVIEHRNKIQTVLDQIDPKLDQLLKEKELHISSDDIHDGWNSSFINKGDLGSASTVTATSSSKPSSAKSAPSSATSTSTSIQTLNKPSATTKTQTPSKPLDQLDELEMLEETEEFSKIPNDQIIKSAKFLERHLYIVSEQQKDALMMSSFESQLAGDESRTKQIIFQALILQYINDLFKASGGARATTVQKETAIGMFTNKLQDKSSTAYKAFNDEFKRTFEHIKKRSELLNKEDDAQGGNPEGVETIQLRSMDADTELVINPPKPDTEEYAAFTKIPKDMQDAVMTGSLDKVNEVFAKMSVEEAEQILELFDESGVISIQALLENEDEFEALKKEYNDEDEQGKLEELVEEDDDDPEDVKKVAKESGVAKDLNQLNFDNDDNDVVINTADIVD